MVKMVIDKDYVINNIDEVISSYKFEDIIKSIFLRNVCSKLGVYLSETAIYKIVYSDIQYDIQYPTIACDENTENQFVEKIEKYLLANFATIEDAKVYIKLPKSFIYWKINANKSVVMRNTNYAGRDIFHLLTYFLTSKIDQLPDEDLIDFINKKIATKDFNVGGYNLTFRNCQNGNLYVKGLSQDALDKIEAMTLFVNNNQRVFNMFK